MKAQLSPQLFKKLKKVDAKIRKSFKERIAIFEKSPYSPQLHNHKLKRNIKDYEALILLLTTEQSMKKLLLEKIQLPISFFSEPTKNYISRYRRLKIYLGYEFKPSPFHRLEI
ncbi:hypothetical protein KKE68_08410 [Patescibacteria group bacterium]|nr:hypothetical protein [Patescibacteria group bacterium]